MTSIYQILAEEGTDRYMTKLTAIYTAWTVVKIPDMKMLPLLDYIDNAAVFQVRFHKQATA